MMDASALLVAEVAAEAGRLDAAAAALTSDGAEPAARQVARRWAAARWQECQGHLAAARRDALQAAGQVPGSPSLSALSWLAAARLCLALGEPKRAQDHLGRAAEIVPEDWTLGQTLLKIGHARLAIFLGRLEEGRELLTGAEPGGGLGVVELQRVQGLLNAASGGHRDAVDNFTSAADLSQRLQLPYLASAAFLGAAEAALAEGDAQRAQDWLADVQGTVEALGYQRLQGHWQRLRGQALRARRDYAGAVAAFVEALRLFIRLEDRLGVACTDLAFGAMLVREPGAGDPGRGLFLLEEARGIFAGAGAVLDEQRAARLAAPGA